MYLFKEVLVSIKNVNSSGLQLLYYCTLQVLVKSGKKKKFLWHDAKLRQFSMKLAGKGLECRIKIKGSGLDSPVDPCECLQPKFDIEWCLRYELLW